MIEVVSQTNDNSACTATYVVVDGDRQYTVTDQYVDGVQECTCGAGSCVHVGVVNAHGCTCGVCDFCLSAVSDFPGDLYDGA